MWYSPKPLNITRAQTIASTAAMMMAAAAMLLLSLLSCSFGIELFSEGDHELREVTGYTGG
jgi:hypothetical protein